MTAYGTYRRSRSLDEPQSSESAIPMEAAESGEAGSTGLQDWEDEGGATRQVTTWAGPGRSAEQG